MSEYTPTTGDVRYEYINGNCEDHPSDAECPTAMRWDVWIKAHDAEVARVAKAEAWDQGYSAAMHVDVQRRNPYREAGEGGMAGRIESIEGSVWPWLKDYDPNEIRRTM